MAAVNAAHPSVFVDSCFCLPRAKDNLRLMSELPTTAQDTLEALECEQVLLWMADKAVTSGGRALFSSLSSEQGSDGIAARRQRGVEALQESRDARVHRRRLATAGGRRRRVRDSRALRGLRGAV